MEGLEGKVVKIIGSNSIFTQFLGRYGVIKEYAYGYKWVVEFNATTKNTGKMIHTVKEIDFEIVGQIYGGTSLLNATVEALKKQTSRKVTHEASLYESCTCPNCKNVIDKFERIGDGEIRIKYNYCHFCGQKLDWHET